MANQLNAEEQQAIREAFQNLNDFQDMLQGVVGLNQRTSNWITVSDGFDSANTLVNHYGYNVKSFRDHLRGLNRTYGAARDAIRMTFSPVAILRLTGILFYCSQAYHTLHEIPDINAIGPGDASIYGNHYLSLMDGDADSDNEGEVSLPTFTGASNWIDFRDKFILKLSLVNGSRSIPLDYVIDTSVRAVTRGNAARVPVASSNVMNANYLKNHAVHFGPQFKEDNKAVWNRLKSALLNTAPYYHISSHDSTKDGRAAWIALKTYYEGHDFQERQQESAFNKLHNTYYRGETKQFTFDKFVNQHKAAHKMLLDVGYNNNMGMDDATKLQYLKAGIKPEAGLEVSLETARANPNINTFDTLVTHLSTSVEHNKLRKATHKQSRDRNVSSTGGRRSNNRSNTNNNRNGKAENNVLSAFVDGKKVFGRNYPRNEFSSLTQAQRRKVIELRRQSRSKSKNNNNDTIGSNTSATDVESMASSICNAVVAGVKRASSSNNEDEQSATSGTAEGSRAESGSVGGHIANRRRRTDNN